MPHLSKSTVRQQQQQQQNIFVDLSLTELLFFLLFFPFVACTVSAIDALDPDIDFLYYYWTWGDGTTGEGRTQYHVFDSPGVYTVTLTVEDVFAVRDTYSRKGILHKPKKKKKQEI